MGCGSSKSTVIENEVSETTKSTQPHKINKEAITTETTIILDDEINIEEPPSLKDTILNDEIREEFPPQEVVSTFETKPNQNNDHISNGTEEAICPEEINTGNIETHLNPAGNSTEPIIFQEQENIISQASESVCSSDYDECLPDDTAEIAEDLLSRVMVDNVIASLTSLQGNITVADQHETVNKVILPPLVLQTEGDNHEEMIKAENATQPDLLPSAGVISQTSNDINIPSYIYTDEDIALQSSMRMVCLCTDNKELKELAQFSTSLRLEKSFASSDSLSKSFIELVSSMKCLQNMNVSGNNSGPVAFRALLTTLIKHNCVTNLDISDNMADTECTDLVAELIKNCDGLKTLNLAGNQLGKESLSRCLATSISSNSNLTSLNISGCGATSLHGLFEGFRTGTKQLVYLDISNNKLKDGQQLGIDLSMILENIDCCLTHLNISGTGLDSTGWEALLSVLKNNTTLKRLYAGGPENQIRNLNVLMQVIFANDCLQRTSLNSIKIDEELDPVKFELDLLHGGQSLIELDIANVGLTDVVVSELGIKLPGRLCGLKVLNISSNASISHTGMQAIKQLCSSDHTSALEELDISVLELEYCSSFLKEAFPELKTLNLRKARMSADALISLPQIPQILQGIILDGIKLSGMNAFNFLGLESKFNLTKLALSGCALVDDDLNPLASALERKGPPLQTLTELNLSVNRLSETSVLNISKALMSTSNHPINFIDLSNNKIGDKGAIGISEFVLSPSCKSNLNKFLISHNCLSVVGITALVNALAVSPSAKGISFLDVSNQKNGLSEDEIEEVSQLLSNLLGVTSDCNTLPTVSPSFHVNISKLGGSAGNCTRSLDSVAIKTDFSNLYNSTAALTDYLLVASGLERAGRGSEGFKNTSFTSEEWSGIVGKDAPAWLKVAADRDRGVYMNHLSGSTTVQRLEGMLEMEADCEVEEIYIIKDPVLRKPTGAAWVLFSTAESVKRAVQWYADGQAQMYGTPFTIGALPVETSESSAAQALAKRELAGREKKRRQEDVADREMMEASQQLADERASYREAHPAYQNGRIW